MTKTRILLSVLTLAFAFAGGLSALAQVDVTSATIKGTVTDPNGGAIPGATIAVTSVDKGISKKAKTASDGTYQIPLLQPGAYEVQVEAAGFDKTVARDVQLSVGQSLVYDFSLRVGAITTVVDITAEAPLIQVEQTQQANTISQLQVENLPNIGRSMTQNVFTLPGVASSEATRAQQPGFVGFLTTGFSIGGSNGRNNLSTIDGGENEYGSGQYRVFIPVDSIQEFQVNRSSFTAEQGFTMGSAVNIVTKSGGNQFHGSAFGYFRDTSTVAANYFSQFSPFGKPFSQNVYTGGTFGGPIVKNKLFFFTSYEFQKLDLAGINFLLNSAPALGINGATTIGLSQLAYVKALEATGNATLQAVAAGLRQTLIPQNNANLLKMLTRDDGAFDNLTKTHHWLTRVDYQPNSNNSVNFRFGLTHDLYGAQSFPDGSSLAVRDVSILTNWAHTFSPSLVNQLRVQIVPHNRADNRPNVDTGTSIVIDSFASGNPAIGSGFGYGPLTPYLAHQKRFQFEDSVSWTKGAHSLKFGGSYRPVDYYVEDDLWLGGEFDFRDFVFPIILAVPAAQRVAVATYNLTHGLPQNGPTLANLSGAESFTLGLPILYHGGFNNPKWHGWANYFGSFAQDTWKVSPRLTIDFGGRLDLDAEPPPLTHKFYFSPRLGFAWDPWGDQKTVIRGGSGIFEGPIDVLIPSYGSLLDDSGKYINQVLSIVGNPFSTVSPATIFGSGLLSGKLPFGHLTAADLNAIGIQTTAGNPNRVVFNVDPNYKNPYTVQASLSIQRRLFNSVALEVGYNMYHGLHLQMPHETNYKETGVVDPFRGPLYAPIDPKILQQATYSSIGKSIYHGMTVSLTKKYSSHLQFAANYTYSKNIDDVIDFNSALVWFRPTKLNLYRAVSVFDFTHNFVANAVYRTPFKPGDGNFLARAFSDMTIAPILTMRSGIPFTIRTPSLTNGLPSTDTNYAFPFPGARDTSRGLPYYSLDMRIQKSLYVMRDRGVRFDLIVEGTNLLNRVNFNRVKDDFPAINGTFTLANGATLNLANGPYKVTGFKPRSIADLSAPGAFVPGRGDFLDVPRQVQFALKVAF
jgi:hypothetical protein